MRSQRSTVEALAGDAFDPVPGALNRELPDRRPARGDTEVPKILIADDEARLRRLISATLERLGHELLEAPDGTSALAAARQERPAVALLDVQMPGLDGLTVCRAIKEDTTLAGTAVIMVTALAGDVERQRGLEAGADAYLAKPFSPLELLKLVERVLAHAA